MRVGLCTVASASHLHLIHIFCPNSGMGTDAPTPFPTGLVATKAHLYLSNPSPDPNPDPDPDPNPNPTPNPHQVSKAMLTVGLSTEDTACVWQCVAALMLLGNLEF